MHLVTHVLNKQRIEGTHRDLILNGGCLDFSSNDYLGLSTCSSIRARLAAALASGCPLGATGSRLLSGNTIYHERVEQFLSKLFGFESALIFSSGFMANLGVMSALGSLGADFFSDELNHASLVDGMKFSKATRQIFRHNDTDHLEQRLADCQQPLKVIVTESVFSMDGDLSPLDEILKLAEKYDAWVVIDEAHATGVFGLRGLGRFEDLKSQYHQVICIHTGGKGLGGQGAFVLSNFSIRELLINRGRTFIFSTALAPLACLQLEFAMEEVLKRPDRGMALLKASAFFRAGLASRIDCGQSQSPIIPVILRSNERVVAASKNLRELGFDVRAVRYPAVKKDQERLRITLKAFHTHSDLNALKNALIHEVCT